MPKYFDRPDEEQDGKALADEDKRKSKYAKMFWKPQKEVENLIRVLPRKAGSKASWHMRYGRHFINHGFLPDGRKDIESYVCMQETYGQPCPGCEEFSELIKTNKVKARLYQVKRYGVFNVIDRQLYQQYLEGTAPFPEVKLYEAPIKSVWEWIVRLVKTKGRMSNIFDTFNEDGTVKAPGRDIILVFNPLLDPSRMYQLQVTDPTPLGTKEHIAKWAKQITELIPENIEMYAPIDYDVAHTKTFGTLDERTELRKALRDLAEAEGAEPEEEKPAPPKARPIPGRKPAAAEPEEPVEEEDEPVEEEEVSTEPPAEDTPEEEAPEAEEAAPEEEEEAPAPKVSKATIKAAVKPVPAVVPKAAAPAPKASALSNTKDAVRARIEAIRAKHAKKD